MVGNQAWDYFKDERNASSKEVSEVRESVKPHIIPSPRTSADSEKAIEAVEQLLTLYQDSAAQDLLNRKLGDLARLRDQQRAAEEARRNAEQLAQKAREETAKVEEARKVAADAEAQKKAAAQAELVRQQEVLRMAEVAAKAAISARNLLDAKAERAQRAFDRSPK